MADTDPLDLLAGAVQARRLPSRDAAVLRRLGADVELAGEVVDVPLDRFRAENRSLAISHGRWRLTGSVECIQIGGMTEVRGERATLRPTCPADAVGQASSIAGAATAALQFERIDAGPTSLVVDPWRLRR